MQTASTFRTEASCPQQPLAIVGMACRLPGAEDLDAFWELLATGGYAIDRMPDRKLDRELYFSAEKGKFGKTYSDVGGFVLEREWDWSLLPIEPSEITNWDECHLNLCEVAAQACQHAGYSPRQIPHKNTGVFIGHSGGSPLGGELAFRILTPDYVELIDDLDSCCKIPDPATFKRELQQRLQEKRPRRIDGKPFVESHFGAEIISHAFGLTGPAIVVDAACASSLVALALAANTLCSGQTEMAIVGGASYNKADSLILFSQAQSCSPSVSRPFDNRADGLVGSEGYIVLLIKTLERAIADGDTVQAVVSGIGISSDGRGRSLWAPRKEGQYEAIRRAYSDSVRPETVQLIEAHATSTQVGDATEMEALASFFAPHLPRGVRLPVGSVKSNIGHTLETAGLAGLVKSVLAIQNKTIPLSVNVEQLSQAIPWEEIPLYVARQTQAWPSPGKGLPRRAAVNAFGIGGLNVHVVVEQYLARQGENQLSSESSQPLPSMLSCGSSHEPIAVIGRGLVVPGATSLSALASFLQQPSSQLCAPPRNRMRSDLDYPVKCGFITDFQYDWRRHRVPPRQIAQANPLQFMLLDAAEQALQEAGCLEHDFDRRQTAVVVGASFGGDFANSLFAGLRLPEIQKHMISLLMRQGCSADVVEQIWEDFKNRFLGEHPAVLDETGSFTSSTLASRLSKTFDLMGGAMAVDAGEDSGLAAIHSAVGMLRSGVVNQVLCAAAQRALDRAALENFRQLELQSGRLADLRESVAIAEGVALVLLKRLDDALADGDRVLAIIDTVDTNNGVNDPRVADMRGLHAPHRMQEFGSDRPAAIRFDSVSQVSVEDRQPASGYFSPLTPYTGHLRAAQGLLDLITFTLGESSETECVLTGSSDSSGQSYRVRVDRSFLSQTPAKNEAEFNTTQPAALKPGQAVASDRDQRNQTEQRQHKQDQPPRLVESDRQCSIERIYRFQAPTLDALRQALATANASSEVGETSASGYWGWRASIVCRPSELANSAGKLASQLGVDASRTLLADQGLFWANPDQPHRRHRLAWLFPGQGSQRVGMLQDLVKQDTDAADELRHANSVLRHLGKSNFEELAWVEDGSLGRDVFGTQAAMLICSTVIQRVLSNRGFRPDLVSSHSYGEFAAMVAAGCWDLESALRATELRCEAVGRFSPQDCGMLSLNAEAEVIQQFLEECRAPLLISHLNSVSQTVVAGHQLELQKFSQFARARRVASRMLPVPTAYHTPFLSAAVKPFEYSLARIPLEPPVIPLLCGTNQQYLAEPSVLRRQLALQLESQLNFVALVRRLEDDGVTLVVEVGPQQVLTKLVRQISSKIQAIATDHSSRGFAHQLLCAQALMELHGNFHASESVVRDHKVAELKQFDATQRRKQRLRLASSGQNPLNQTGKSTSLVPQPLSQSDRVIGPGPGGSRGESAQQALPEIPASRPAHSAGESERDAIQATGFPDPTTPVVNEGYLHDFLINFVVEQTGYPKDLLELDWDLEADLGIDSIKKAQLFGELRELLPLEFEKGDKFETLRTLRDILEFLERLPAQADAATSFQAGQRNRSTENSISTTYQSALLEQQAENPAIPQAEAELTQFLVDFVVEQTGYPAEIVELDADLEADLGIDSIKKAQMLGEIRELFPVPGMRDVESQRPSDLADYKTLRDIVDGLLNLQQQEKADLLQSGVEIQSESSQLRLQDIQRKLELTAEAGFSDSRSGTAAPETSSDDCRGETEVVPAPVQLPIAFVDASDAERPPKFLCSDEYVEAVEKNLHAMVSRRRSLGDRDDSLLGTPQRDWWKQRLQSLARHTSCSTESLHAFEVAANADFQWYWDESRPINGQSQDVIWLATMEGAAWLLDNGTDTLAQHVVHSEQSSRVELTFAGLVAPLAVVVEDRLLLVVSTSGGAPIARELSWLLQQVDHTSLDNLADQLHNWSLDADWRLFACDCKSRRGLSFECLGGRPHTRFVTLNPTADSLTPSGKFPIARLGLDLNLNCFVVWCPSGYSRLQIPRVSAVASVNLIPELSRRFSADLKAETSEIAARYTLSMASKPARHPENNLPEWSGTAVVVGDNRISREIQARLHAAGVNVFSLVRSEDPQALADEFARLTANHEIPHLFLTTPHDVGAEVGLDVERWEKQKKSGILGPYWLCQKWCNHIVDRQLTDRASLVAVTSLGGDFGFQSCPTSIEGGGLAGLLKSMLVEFWTQGYRPLTVKIIDTHPQQTAEEIVEGIWHELAVPSYDIEISYADGVRKVVQARKSPISLQANPISESSPAVQGPSQGGVWLCTGGARGITAFAAEHLAMRYGLELHLIGKTPVPNLPPEWRGLDADGLRNLKVEVMTRARQENRNPLDSWQAVEKQIEIDATLRRLQSRGIRAHYHACDVSDRKELAAIVATVRAISGPIRGVLHGAGVGKDARFDRKQVDKVEQCIAAKVDGGLALMEVTRDDPLECFIGFGSISGRFGANGHTDYSLANDMLCKLIDWYACQRPKVHAIGFHWHAWGDVGMATKPETRLALEMVDMQFMPAAEGVQHLMRELESRSIDREVLITDDRYYRMFYPAEQVVDHKQAIPAGIARVPLLKEEIQPCCGGQRAFAAPVDPSRDPFLTEHLLQGRPLLPFVVAIEMLWESASLTLDSNRLVLKDVEACGGVRFFHDEVRELRLETQPAEGNSIYCQLRADFVTRNGSHIDPNRLGFHAYAFPHGNQIVGRTRWSPQSPQWQRAEYAPIDASFFLGWPLQRLRRFCIGDQHLLGKICAPALIELAGNHRDVIGWRTPSAVLDACLYAAGMLAWHRVAAGTALPVRMGCIAMGKRLPDPGEACTVHVLLKSQYQGRAVFDFSLYGVDGEPLIDVVDYDVVWLKENNASEKSGQVGDCTSMTGAKTRA